MATWFCFVVAEEEVGQLFADAEVCLLTSLLTQSLQLIDIAMAIVLEIDTRVSLFVITNLCFTLEANKESPKNFPSLQR